MAKIGRNDPCPCRSGKKYKRCHGWNRGYNRIVLKDVTNLEARMQAERIQRERQQGLGKPIISAEVNGRRLVAVKNRLLQSKGWMTFQDFLLDYIKIALGSDWGNTELAKPIAERHPILVWYKKVEEYKRLFLKKKGKISQAPITGAVAAYLHLAYDLYALDHNAELQEKLLARLRNRDKFTGALYEVFVAATFIRAGFDIEFEDESDGTTTHCEFTATHGRTGRRFSVEAKRREGQRFNMGHLFNNALSKRANHRRVIFIDLNMHSAGTGQHIPDYFDRALRRLRSFEGKSLNGAPRPAAYVFVTNTPWADHLDAPAPICEFLIEGFQIGDFKGGVKAPNLRAAIEARKAHIEMHRLMESIKDHSDVPATFDGQMPVYAFNPNLQRLIIGQRYMVKDQDGVDRPAELTAAEVVESERVAYCGVRFEDGHSIICTIPLAEEEVAAWKQHPDTFFGVVGQRIRRADTPLEMYDFLYESFLKTSRKQLLAAMANAPDIEQLTKLDHESLADLHAERMAIAAFATGEHSSVVQDRNI